jgi:4-amino-4-deoxy-L-arabinose transferase-like glycosyltransferase
VCSAPRETPDLAEQQQSPIRRASSWLDGLWAKFKQATGLDPDNNVEDRLFMYLLIIALGLRLIWLDRPRGSLIFDEVYYVNVARILDGIPWDKATVYSSATIGLDPNVEHPPLAKLLLAFSLAVIGNNGYGWRIPSVVFGMLSIFFFYLIVQRLTKAKWVPIIATFMLTFDTLSFVHSRIATLDIFFVGFMLMGFYFYLAGKHAVSALMLALSTLSKLGGLFGFVIIVAYHIVGSYQRGELATRFRDNLAWFEKYTAIYLLSGLIGLFVMNLQWGIYKNPFDHMELIYRYTSSLVRDPLQGIESNPWQWWFFNQVEIPYLKVNVNVIVRELRTIDLTTATTTVIVERVEPGPATIEFLGKMNWVVLVLSWISIPYALWESFKKKSAIALFAVLWFVFHYVTWYPAALIAHRIMYIHYFLPTVPAISMANAHMLVELNPPRIIVLGILALVLVFFGFYFPFKGIP